MNNLLLVLTGLTVSTAGLAQRPDPGIVAPAGGVAHTKTMALAWTVGEPVVTTVRTTDRLYTQGFHQPMLRVEALKASDPESPWQLSVAPNPVVYALTVAVATPAELPLSVSLLDMNGRRQVTKTLAGGSLSVSVNMADLPAGMYMLHISQPTGRLTRTYKIIKQ